VEPCRGPRPLSTAINGPGKNLSVMVGYRWPSLVSLAGGPTRRPALISCFTRVNCAVERDPQVLPSARLLPPPALGECCHRSLARRLVAVDRRAIFVVAIGQRPQPRRAPRRRGSLHDAADNYAVGKHIIIIVTPLAGQAGSRRAFEDEVVFFHPTTFGFSCGPPLERPRVRLDSRLASERLGNVQS
jgi:hypothetical protein